MAYTNFFKKSLNLPSSLNYLHKGKSCWFKKGYLFKELIARTIKSIIKKKVFSWKISKTNLFLKSFFHFPLKWFLFQQIAEICFQTVDLRTKVSILKLGWLTAYHRLTHQIHLHTPLALTLKLWYRTGSEPQRPSGHLHYIFFI